MVCWRPGALNLTNSTSYNERLQVKLFGQNGPLRDTLQLPGRLRRMKRWWRDKDGGAKCLVFVFLLSFVLFCLFLIKIDILICIFIYLLFLFIFVLFLLFFVSFCL